ncbi:MAG: FecR family protein [Chloroherpetonaceae bacterium]|nr:FecR family protein [Chloroherpetonaceae bacterium]MDW8018684.1 FecR family protein [Chloroherpetonaceae bacterium]
MMKKVNMKIAFLSIALYLTASWVQASEKPKPDASKTDAQGVAIVVKAIKVVEAKEKQSNWRSVQRGQQLNSGTQVRTGAQSFSILKFADNSVVRISENSEIVVRGDKAAGNAMNKTVELNLGKVGFNIKKQGQGEVFRFSSPTAVASIKGTTGYFGNGSLLILSGLASLSLPDGSLARDVGEGQIGIVANGQVEVRPATQEELDEARRIVGEINERITIKFRDKNGNIREIEIR